MIKVSQQAAMYSHALALSAYILLFVFCAATFSNAGSDVISLPEALPAAAAWGMIWLIRFIVDFRQQRFGKPARHHPLRYRLVEPAATILPLTRSFLGVLSSMRFALSGAVLSNYAGNVKLAFDFQHPPRRLGLYTATFADSLADGTVRIITSSHSLLGRAGFAPSSHNRPPSKSGEDCYQHIHRQWRYRHESWQTGVRRSDDKTVEKPRKDRPARFPGGLCSIG